MWWAGEPPDLLKNPVLRLLQHRFRVTDNLHGERFFVRSPDPRTGTKVFYLTPLFLALILIEVTDAILAVDSIPATFAITTDTYVVYTSDIFAILALRAFYFALSEDGCVCFGAGDASPSSMTLGRWECLRPVRTMTTLFCPSERFSSA